MPTDSKVHEEKLHVREMHYKEGKQFLFFLLQSPNVLKKIKKKQKQIINNML